MMMMITYLPIDRASGRSGFLHAHHRVLVAHFFACLALPRLAFYTALPPHFPSQMSCHATLSIIERSGEASDGVHETTSCPSSLLHLRQQPSASLPPVLLLFLLISSSLVATVSPSLSFALSVTVLILSCLVFLSSHFKYDKETDREV